LARARTGGRFRFARHSPKMKYFSAVNASAGTTLCYVLIAAMYSKKAANIKAIFVFISIAYALSIGLARSAHRDHRRTQQYLLEPRLFVHVLVCCFGTRREPHNA